MFKRDYSESQQSPLISPLAPLRLSRCEAQHSFQHSYSSHVLPSWTSISSSLSKQPPRNLNFIWVSQWEQTGWVMSKDCTGVGKKKKNSLGHGHGVDSLW